MLNEGKLKLMTCIAMFEKAERKRFSIVIQYYMSDYISRNLLRSFIGYTFCWCIGLAMVAVFKLEDILSIISLTEVVDFFLGYIVWYVGGLIIYLIITVLVSFIRYRYAARGMKVYLSKLKRLEKRYEVQSRAKEGKEVIKP